MVYTVKTRRSILAFLVAFNIVNMSFESEGSSKYLFYFQIVLQIFILIGLFLDYKLKIDDSFLTYQISLFRVNLSKKRMPRLSQARAKRELTLKITYYGSF